MTWPTIRGGALTRIGLLHVLAGVLPPVGCYRAPTPTHQVGPVDRPAARHSEQAIDEELPRRFAGVVMARTPTGGVSIRLLGGTGGLGPPLYVIDGAPLLADPGRGFDWLKPEDVEWVTVLRDPAETAVYGPRGVNGVILITTKQARARR